MITRISYWTAISNKCCINSTLCNFEVNIIYLCKCFVGLYLRSYFLNSINRFGIMTYIKTLLGSIYVVFIEDLRMYVIDMIKIFGVFFFFFYNSFDITQTYDLDRSVALLKGKHIF